MLQITKKELFYQRRNVYETMRVHGIPCKVYSISRVLGESYDFYQDIADKETSYTESVDTWMTYEEYPKIKTLKSLGWYIESEQFPIIGYIPTYYPVSKCRGSTFTPCIDDRVDIITNPYDENTSTRSFLIKDFVGNGFPSVTYFTVKLVPYYVDKEETNADGPEDTTYGL